MRRSLAFLCTLALLLGMIVPSAMAADTTCSCCGATNVTWTNFTADTVPEPGVHYRLFDDVEKKGQWTLETVGTYCIDLAGKTLTTDSRAFIAGNNTTKPAVVLNLMDSSANQTGVIESSGSTNSAWSAGVLYSCNNATINLYGGTVTTTDVNTPSAGKGAVVNALGNFNMYGGTIVGGTAQTFGGAVSIQSNGVFTMSGGAIRSGTAPVGACVYLASTARMTLSGNARVDQVYADGTLTKCVTIRGVYTGSVELACKDVITSGSAVATADNADISGAAISVPDKNLAAAVSGTTIVVGDGYWCQACEKTVVWQSLTASQLVTMNEKKQVLEAGHYRLAGNVASSQMHLQFNGTVCLDLAGYTYSCSSRTFILGVNAGTYDLTMNIMDSSPEQTGRLTGRGGSNAMAAGVIYAYKNTTVNIYSGTIEAMGDGVMAKNGGALDIYGTVNMYGGTVIGNHVANNGGAVCLLSGAKGFYMYGGKVVGGKADNLGNCIYVPSGAEVKLSGNATVDEIYFAGSSASTLTVAGNYTGKATLKFANTPAAGADIGNVENVAMGKENLPISGTRLYATVSGANLVATKLTGAVIEDTYYNTLAAALAAAKKGDTVKLLESATTATTPDGITLDLNGWNIDSLTANGKLYVKDSATDDFTVEDVYGYGKIVALTGNAAPAEGYFALRENGTSFHHYMLKLTKVNLRPGATGIYYSAQIQMDEVTRKKAENWGIAVSTNTDTPAADDDSSLCTVGTNSVLVSGIMDGEATDAVDAATLIYGRPYIKFTDGSYLYGNVCSTTLQQVTETVDKLAWGNITLAQNRALTAMYDTYKAEMNTWAVNNLHNSAAKKQAAADDGVFKAIVIGNSASVDATSLLAAIFQAEAPDQEFVLGCMYESGCSVKGHVGFLEDDAAAYTYYKNTGSDQYGRWTLYKESTLQDGLTDQNWDVVIFQELHTVSGLLPTFTDNNHLETLITYVVDQLGYEPKLTWHSVGIIPEIPQAYVDYVLSLEGDDGGGTDAGENEGWEDDGTSQPEDLAWIFDIARPGYPVTWAKNYINNFGNNAQVMYDAICDVAVNYIMPNKTYSFDDVIPGGSVIQYARNMGMTDRDLFRDYAHKSDYGRVLIGYVWYASLMGITEMESLAYTTVPTQIRHTKSPKVDLVLTQEQYDMALAAINYALKNPFDSPTPVSK